MDYYEYRTFRKFIEGLENQKHKKILQLAFYDGLRVKEIARKLSLKLILVRSILRKYLGIFNSRRCKDDGNKKQTSRRF